MKRGFFAAVVLVFLVVFPFCAQGGQGATWQRIYPCIALPKQPLDAKERSALIYMREEEKLARDVYLTLYKKWGLPVFGRIVRSEERHMDAVGRLLEKYGIPDPVKGGEVGAFSNPEMKKLYNKLVSQGSASLQGALKVGATIEDLDIADLQERLAQTDNKDIRCVFQHLMEGSENHLRAFVRQLRRLGASYTPQYISQEEFDRIVSSGRGRGRGMWR